MNEWLSQIKLSTRPTIIPDLESVEIEGKIVVSVVIQEYPVKPVNTKGKYYRRISTSNHQLSLSEIANLYMQSLQLSWDSYEATNHSIDDLSVNKIEKFIEQVNQSGRFNLDSSPILALEKLKFLVNGRPSWAALLLFAEVPLRHHIHIGRFKTPSMIIDDRQITDTLFEAVDQAMKFIVSHISVAFSFDGSLQRKETFAFPLPALREALLNAVVHRDYANPSDIQIKIFDDKITFFSPGNLFGGLKIVDFSTDFYQSRLRNKLIAEAFYLTKNIEKYGSGFIRIRKEIEKYPKFTFTSDEISGGVLLTFSFGGVNDEMGGVNNKIGGVNNEIGGVNDEIGGVNNEIGGVNDEIGGVNDEIGGVNDEIGGVNDEIGGVNEIINFIKMNQGSNTSEIAKSLKIPKRTIERFLKQLKAANKIEFKGSPKKGGYFNK